MLAERYFISRHGSRYFKRLMILNDEIFKDNISRPRATGASPTPFAPSLRCLLDVFGDKSRIFSHILYRRANMSVALYFADILRWFLKRSLDLRTRDARMWDWRVAHNSRGLIDRIKKVHLRPCSIAHTPYSAVIFNSLAPMLPLSPPPPIYHINMSDDILSLIDKKIDAERHLRDASSGACEVTSIGMACRVKAASRREDDAEVHLPSYFRARWQQRVHRLSHCSAYVVTCNYDEHHRRKANAAPHANALTSSPSFAARRYAFWFSAHIYCRQKRDGATRIFATPAAHAPHTIEASDIVKLSLPRNYG